MYAVAFARRRSVGSPSVLRWLAVYSKARSSEISRGLVKSAAFRRSMREVILFSLNSIRDSRVVEVCGNLFHDGVGAFDCVTDANAHRHFPFKAFLEFDADIFGENHNVRSC